MSGADRKTSCVVLSPEVLGRSFFDASCRDALQAWRDGALRLAVTRPLLLRYLRLLRSLGVDRDEVLRSWILWFTSDDKTNYFPDVVEDGKDISALCEEAARLANANAILIERPADLPDRKPGAAVALEPGKFCEIL